MRDGARMGRKLETAHISFGLVTIPVGIYAAIQEQEIHFNQHYYQGSLMINLKLCITIGIAAIGWMSSVGNVQAVEQQDFRSSAPFEIAQSPRSSTISSANKTLASKNVRCSSHNSSGLKA